MAHACLAVAPCGRMQRCSGLTPRRTARLLLASLRARLRLADYGEGKPQALRAARSILTPLLKLRIGLRPRILYGFCLALLPLSLWLVPGSRRWVVAPEEMPRTLSRVLSWAPGPNWPAAGAQLIDRDGWLRRLWAVSCLVAAIDGAALFNTFDWRFRPLGRRPGALQRNRRDRDSRSVFPRRRQSQPRAEGGRTLCAHAPGGIAHDLRPGCRTDPNPGRGTVVGRPGARLDAAGVTARPDVVGISSSLVACRSMDAAKRPGRPAGSDRARNRSAPTGKYRVRAEHGRAARFCRHRPSMPGEPAGGPGPPGSSRGRELVLRLARPALAEATELVVRFQEDQIEGSLVATDQSGPSIAAGFADRPSTGFPLAPASLPTTANST